MIKHYKHNEIDKALWDNCIEKSSNRLIYGFSWYLDIISPGWEALVIDDYKAVLPLPVKRKFAIKHVYQPWLAQQLGIFGESEEFNIKEIISILKRRYLFGFINFNSHNQLQDSQFNIRTNLILDLNKDYDQILGNYSKNHKRNIAKSKKQGLEIRSIAANDLFSFFKQSNLVQKVGWQKAHIDQMIDLADISAKRKKSELIGVYKDDNLVSAIFYLLDNSRLTYIFPVTIEHGYKLGAQFFLIDYLIQKFANKGVIIDFEGSSVASIARFYKGFGAEEELYFSVFFLPFFKFSLNKGSKL